MPVVIMLAPYCSSVAGRDPIDRDDRLPSLRALTPGPLAKTRLRLQSPSGRGATAGRSGAVPGSRRDSPGSTPLPAAATRHRPPLRSTTPYAISPSPPWCLGATAPPSAFTAGVYLLSNCELNASLVMSRRPSRAVLVFAAILALLTASCAGKPAPSASTANPIHHLVIIFQENVSFDHYFGTYPHAVNIDGQPFTALPGTPTVDGLTPELLTSNPNKGSPMRLGDPAQQVTCSQDHEYTAEQKAFHGGAMDQFIENTEVFGDLGTSGRFVEAYLRALESLHRDGARATL